MANLRSAVLGTLVLIPVLSFAQDRYISRTGVLTLHSSTPLEDIDAENRRVASVIDPAAGTIAFSALVKAFEFPKAMMQEHFNEDYMESDKFPKTEFKGKLKGLATADLAKAGKYDVTAEGALTVHGVTRQISQPGVITVGPDGTVHAESAFLVKPEDYGMTVPGVVRDKIAERMEVKVSVDYKKR